MKCYHCGGNMVYQIFYGLYERFWGWRCIFCGEIVDQVIINNRLLQRSGEAMNTSQ